MKPKNFIKFINQNHSIMTFVVIFIRPNSRNDTEKDNAILENRKLMGATDPLKADEGK